MTTIAAAIRNTVRSDMDFIHWAAKRGAGDAVSYHIGNLGQDRIKSPALHMLAETVSVMDELACVTTQQFRMPLADRVVTWYIASRTGQGYIPDALFKGEINAVQWRALKALKERFADQSTTRCVRDALGCSDDQARAIIGTLRVKNWVAPVAHQARTLEITLDGLRALKSAARRDLRNFRHGE